MSRMWGWVGVGVSLSPFAPRLRAPGSNPSFATHCLCSLRQIMEPAVPQFPHLHDGDGENRINPCQRNSEDKTGYSTG